MPDNLHVSLSPEQRQELETARDHHRLPYLRERAAAILKIASGSSGRQVARQGLLKARKPDTVYDWVRRYEQGGLAGLVIQPGRGRKPAFSPSDTGAGPDRAAACLGARAGGLRAGAEPLDAGQPAGEP